MRAEDPHRFRKARPAKMALASRAYRANLRQLLRRASRESGPGEDLPSDPARRKRPHLVGRIASVPLGVSVQSRLGRRWYDQVWSYWRGPYESREHRLAFAQLLRAMTSGLHPAADCMGASRKLASQLAAILGARDRPALKHHANGEWCGPVRARAEAWMRAFLADESAWSQRLLDWFDRGGAQPPPWLGCP